MTPGDAPSDASQEEREALEHIKAGQLELARNKIAMLSKKYPNVAKYHFNYALVLYKLKRYDEALDEISSGLWLKPDDLKALKFKKEIIELRSNAIEEGQAKASEDKAGIEANDAIKGEKGTISDQLATSTVQEPITELAPQEPEPAAPPTFNEPKLPKVDVTPVSETGSDVVPEKGYITGVQPETMPAIHVPTPSPEAPGPESEVMPSVKVPGVPDEAKAAEPAPVPAEEEKAAEPAPVPAEEEKAAEPAPVPAEEEKSAEPAPVPAEEEKAAEPAPVPAEEEKAAEPAQTTELVTTQPTMVEEEPHIELEKPATGKADADEQHGAGPEPAVVCTTEPTAEPKLVSSIPGPAIVETSVAAEQPPAATDTIEIEPRITIHEKAADITVTGIEASPPAPAEPSVQEHEPAPQGIDSSETEHPVNATVASPRLTNLKDLFKGSRPAVESPKEAIEDTGAVLEDTVELEPGPMHTMTEGSGVADENKLVSFSSLKELDSYKFSIQALVEKYLHHKLDHELDDTIDDGSLPVIVDDGSSPVQEKAPFREADIPPHEAASADDADATEALADDPAAIAGPQPTGAGTSVHGGAVPEPGEGAVQQAEPGASAPVPSVAGIDGSLKNILGDQQPFIEILSTTSGHLPHRLEIDIMQFINASVMEKARTSKLMQVRGEILAQIVDMDTYAALVRSNRAIGKKKPTRVNTIKSLSADQAIKEIETCAHPGKSYQPDSFAKEEPADVEEQISQLASGSQHGMTEDALAEFIAHVKEVGEGQAMMVAGGDDAPPLKAATAKIKRVALDLYNDTQYEQAVQIYSVFVSYFPEDYEALFNLGFCHRELGNYAESEAMFKRIIELFYDNAYAWYNLSVIYSITTEGDKEAYCLQRAREFGYAVDINRLSRLLVTYTPKNPFDA